MVTLLMTLSDQFHFALQFEGEYLANMTSRRFVSNS